MGGTISTPAPLYLSSTLTYLGSTFEQDYPSNCKLRDFEVEFRGYLNKWPLHFRDNVPLTFNIRNIGCKVIPSFSTVKFNSPTYKDEVVRFPRDLKPYEEFSFQIELQNKIESNMPALKYLFDSFVPKVAISFHTKSNVKIFSYSASFILPYEYFTASFINYNSNNNFGQLPPSFHNNNNQYLVPQNNNQQNSRSGNTPDVLIFGWAGAGKSTLLNCFLTYFSQEVENVAIAGSFMGHTTGECSPFYTNSATLWDTKGLHLVDEYTNDTFRALLRNPFRDTKVILFVLQAECGEPEMNRLKQFIQISDKMRPRIPSIMVVTHMDRVHQMQDTIHRKFHDYLNEFLSIAPFYLDLSKPTKSLEQDKAIGSILVQIFTILRPSLHS